MKKRNATFGYVKWLSRPGILRAERVRGNRRWYNPTLRSEIVPLMIQHQGTRMANEALNNFGWYRERFNPRPWSK